MDAGAGSIGAASATVDAAGVSGAHLGQRLYNDAVRTASKAIRGVGGSDPSEMGESAFAHAIKDGRRPPDSLVQHLDDWYEFHTGVQTDLGSAIDKSCDVYRPRFAERVNRGRRGCIAGRA